MKKKFLSLVLSLAMVFAMTAPAMAVEDATPVAASYTVPADVKGKLVILHTNDTHGGDMASADRVGTAGVAQLKKDFEAAGADVLLLSDGDAIQGTPLVNLDKGASAITFMNAAGYDAMAPGNHEFDYGKDNLLSLKDAADFPVLSANIIDKSTGKPLFEANSVFTTASGLKVGVFGLDTPETASKANPKYVEGLTFLQGEDLYKCAQAQVDALKAEGVDVIVCLGHLGIDEGSAPNRSIDVVKNVTGIDLFIDGHSHSTNDAIATAIGGSNVLNGTLIVSTGTKLANVGVVTYSGGKLDFGYVSAGSYTGADQSVADLVSNRNTEVDAQLSQVFAKTEVNLNGERAPGVRTQETNLGDFAADAILWQAREYFGGDDKVQAAFTNGGGIRASIPAGDISMKDMKTVFPFGNAVYTLDLKGSQILEMLEANTNVTPTALGGFPQVAGMTFTIDTSTTYQNGDKYGDTTFYAPADPGSRIKDVTIAGEPLDLNKTYTLATNDFTAAGGDAYYVLTQAENGYNTTVSLEDALVNYTTDVLGGLVTAVQYGQTAGRITVKYVGVEPGAWYVDAARYVMDNGIMSSTGNGFDPTATVTRATVFQTLYNMEGKPAVSSAATFSDVAGMWYADSAAWAETNGLTTGDGTGAYAGDRSVTRAELATIIARYAEYGKMDVSAGGMAMREVADYDQVPSWALSGMATCYYNGIIGGKPGNLLDPNGTAIRSELATILKNYGNLEPATPGYDETTVSIEVPAQDGVPAHTIPAIVTLPEGDGKYPAVVMLHGTGSDKHEAGGGYDMAAPAMATSGIASIRFDFMGNGDSTADYADYSYTSANIDAKAAADYMASLSNVDASKLAVMGWSQGGTNALLAAAKYPDTFKAVITWSGATSLDSLFPEGFDKAYATAQKDGSYTLAFDWRDSLQVGLKWFQDVKDTDVLQETAKIKAPVLAFTGSLDTTVPPENATKIANAAQNGRAFVIDGADHTYNVFTGDYSAIIKTINTGIGFLEQSLNGALEPAYVASISKYGNVTTTLPVDLFNGAGYEVGDILKVTVGNQTMDVPYVTTYSNVDTGKVLALPDTSSDSMALAINMGNFSTTYGITQDTSIIFSMGEKAGYLEEYAIRNIDSLRTNNRSDYASDEVFANFRPIVMGNIAEGVLYRSSSPVNPELGRNTYADALAKKAGIQTVINLADDEATMKSYAGYADTYYSTLNIVALDMGVDFAAEDFNTKLKTGLEYMIANKGPYLIHCNEGKDRAGFVSALLESLMGGTLDEIKADYMLSYENYYHVEKDSDRYNRIAESNIMASLRMIAGLDEGADLSRVDLQKAASDYLVNTVGMTNDQVTALQGVLATGTADLAA